MDLSKATKGRRMSKTTHKKAPKPKAGKPKVGTKPRTKAKASARTTAGTVAKVGTKAKSKSAGVRASKAGAARSAGKTASRTAAASSKAKPPAKKVATKAPAAATSRTAIRKIAKPSSAESVRAEAALEHTGPGLVIGSKVPPFQLPRDGGETVSLQSFAGRKLVLFFYPRASTPGCTKEAMDFSRLSGAFAALGADVVGVSADPQRTQETFRDKHDLTVPLLSDEAHTVLESFGVWGDKSLYGKIFQGIIRTTVLIGPDGSLINIWRNVKVDGHAETVLKYVQNL
jgi:peroxiredoxin Q/BCP